MKNQEEKLTFNQTDMIAIAEIEPDSSVGSVEHKAQNEGHLGGNEQPMIMDYKYFEAPEWIYPKFDSISEAIKSMDKVENSDQQYWRSNLSMFSEI